MQEFAHTDPAQYDDEAGRDGDTVKRPGQLLALVAELQPAAARDALAQLVQYFGCQ